MIKLDVCVCPAEMRSWSEIRANYAKILRSSTPDSYPLIHEIATNVDIFHYFINEPETQHEAFALERFPPQTKNAADVDKWKHIDVKWRSVPFIGCTHHMACGMTKTAEPSL